MSAHHINQILNLNTPRLDPNGPSGPTGPTGPAKNASGTPSHSYNYQTVGPTGTVGCPTGPAGPAGATGANTTALPNGTYITIPYTPNGWYYNITIPAPPKEKVQAKPKDDRDGCDCIKCKTFFEFSEPNQEDGTLICWACRHGY